MKLTVIDKEAFDQWRDRVLKELSKPDSPYLDEDRTGLLDYKKIDSPISRQNSREIEVLPTTCIEKVIDLFMRHNLFTITQRIKQAQQKGKVNIVYRIYYQSVGRGSLSLSKTVADYDIQEGDLLLLDADISNPDIHVSYLLTLMTTGELTDYCDIIQTSEDIEQSLSNPSNDDAFGSTVKSILLYTDEDANLAQYIRYNYLSLNEMTGHYLDIHTIEQASQVRGISPHEYWKATLKQTTYSFLYMMGWTRYKPYNKAEAYRIANMLGIYPDALPCMIIFGNIKSDEKIVVTITGEIQRFFRGLSSAVLRTLQKVAASKINLDENFDEFKKVFMESWSAWQKEVGEKKEQTANFTFNGETLFVNRPSGQVEIKKSSGQVEIKKEE